MKKEEQALEAGKQEVKAEESQDEAEDEDEKSEEEENAKEKKNTEEKKKSCMQFFLTIFWLFPKWRC